MNAKVKRIKADFAFDGSVFKLQKDFHGDFRVGGVFEQLVRFIAMRYQESDLYWSLLFFDFC